MSDFSIFAFQSALGGFCPDARLGGDADNKGLAYPQGDLKGQAGWDMALRFENLHDLAEILRLGPQKPCDKFFSSCGQVMPGEVTRLGIMAHGAPGQIQINGPDQVSLTASNVIEFHSDLHQVGLATREGASILFLSCLAGQGPRGTALLTKLSHIWPKRKIVAFATLGYIQQGVMMRAGKGCTEVGARETDNPNGWIPGMSTNPFDAQWNDLKKMPWESESSPFAKVVTSDKGVEKYPLGERPVTSKDSVINNGTTRKSSIVEHNKGSFTGTPRPASQNGRHR